MSNLMKNVILEGIFASENVDSSGEVLSISGADISTLPNALVNQEHINPEDMSKNKDKHEDDIKGFSTIIGRVLKAKKIFTEEDCKTDKEKEAFKSTGKKPLIYGQVEVYDGEDASDDQRATAALARMFNKDPNGPQLGLSVEGSTLRRDGNVLSSSVIRKMAMTLRPCNHRAKISLVKDSTANNPSKVNKSEQKTIDGFEPLYKSVQMSQIYVKPQVNDFGLSLAVSALKKAMTAGSTNAAPSTLTGGAALQKESSLASLARTMAKKPINKDSVKKALPSVSEQEAETIEKALKKYFFEKTLEKCEKIYKSMSW
jgi:hypothetical protein